MNSEYQAQGDNRPRVGRPKGSSRIPLSHEERRARNARYESERRRESAMATAELANAVGCAPTTSQTLIMKEALKFLQKPKHSTRVKDLKRQNEILQREIEHLTEMLELSK